MQIKPLRSMVGSYGSIRKGVIATVPDHIAQQLVKRGVAVPVQAGKDAGAAKSAPTRPSKASQNGGRTGAAKRSSSSPADPAQETPPSKKSADASE
jgi:hypothetical protein